MNGQWGLNYYRPDDSTDVDVEATDPNTDATNPLHADGEALRPRAFIYNQRRSGSPNKLGVFVVDGTSLDVEVWVYDSGLTKWFKIGADTVTSADGFALFDAIPGAFHFVRVVTNTDNVQAYGVGSI